MRAFIVAVAIAGILLGWLIFAGNESQRHARVHAVRVSHSELHVALVIAYAAGPIERESWSVGDVDGRSSAGYAVTDRNGRTVRVDARMQNSEVPFLFDAVVRDGIWQAPSRPQRGETSEHYTVTVSQKVGAAGGARTFTFTDPHYWAVTAGREYHIVLDRGKPVPDVLKLRGTSLADPRYLAIVSDIEAFGSPRFRAAEERARSSLAAHHAYTLPPHLM